MSPRLALLALALAPVLPAAGCSSDPPLGGPVPGGNPPGAACSTAADCYCWQCVCEGLSGAPGEVQLCVSGQCPTGEDACATSCSLAGAKVKEATSGSSCNGRP